MNSLSYHAHRFCMRRTNTPKQSQNRHGVLTEHSATNKMNNDHCYSTNRQQGRQVTGRRRISLKLVTAQVCAVRDFAPPLRALTPTPGPGPV